MAGPPHRSWSVIAASGRWREDWTRNPCDDDDREHCGTGKLVRVAQAVAPTLTDVIRSAPRPANPMSPTPASERCAQIATSSNSSAVQEPGASACAISATRSPIPDGRIGATTALAS